MRLVRIIGADLVHLLPGLGSHGVVGVTERYHQLDRLLPRYPEDVLDLLIIQPAYDAGIKPLAACCQREVTHGDTDVDLVVYDSNGNRICSSTRGGDREYCRWTPAWTGEFTVRVSNYGRVYNAVTMVTN